MDLLKTIGKFFAGFFALFGLTIFIMSAFGLNAINNLNVLEQDLSSGLGITMDEIEKYCSENPGQCEDNILLSIKKETDEFIYYGNAMSIIGFVFFLLGFLIFVWCFNWKDAVRKTSLISLVGIVFSYFYYKFMILGALSNFLPQEIMSIIGNWVSVVLKETLSYIAVLGIIFLILTVIFYVLRYREKGVVEKSNE